MPNRSPIVDSPSPRERLLLRRRDFLALGSVGVAGLWLGGLGRADAGVPPAPVVLPARPMSLGYIEGSDQLPNVIYLPRSVLLPSTAPRAGGPADGILNEITAADGLPDGDTALVGKPFRMKVHGLYPPGALTASRLPLMPLAIDLDVLFPPPDPVFPKPARFAAWSFRRTLGWNPSPPTKFVYPLDWQTMPQLEMRVTSADGGKVAVLTTQFTLDQEKGRPRLRRGLYLLGLSPGVFETDLALADLARVAPIKLLSVLISFETYPAGT